MSYPTSSLPPSPFRHIRRSLPAVAFIMALAACGKQGEGERCDLNNGDLDCESGLVCRILDSGWSLCCPQDIRQPAVDACLSGSTELPEDEGEPAESIDAGGQTPADGGGSGS